MFILVFFGKRCFDGPVFLGYEFLDFPLAFDDQADRDRLHASGREAGPDFLPKKRGELVTDEAI